MEESGSMGEPERREQVREGQGHDGEEEDGSGADAVVEEGPPEDIGSIRARRFQRYSEVLGEGMFKTVYRGFDVEEGLEVAWNVVSTEVFTEDETVAILGEIDLLGRMEHTSIIDLYGFWHDASACAIVFITEKMSGSLAEYVRKREPSVKAIKRWCRHILEGLIYLHTQTPPVIHRDLKLDNIFVNAHLGNVKLGDLGLATAMTAAESSDDMAMRGTPGYMAPEVFNHKYNEKLDVYSFGMCVLEMATQQTPYAEENNIMALFKKQADGATPDSLALVEDQPELHDFITMCIAPASHRPSAAEVMQSPFLAVPTYDRVHIYAYAPAVVVLPRSDAPFPTDPPVVMQLRTHESSAAIEAMRAAAAVRSAAEAAAAAAVAEAAAAAAAEAAAAAAAEAAKAEELRIIREEHAKLQEKIRELEERQRAIAAEEAADNAPPPDNPDLLPVVPPLTNLPTPDPAAPPLVSPLTPAATDLPPHHPLASPRHPSDAASDAGAGAAAPDPLPTSEVVLRFVDAARASAVFKVTFPFGGASERKSVKFGFDLNRDTAFMVVEELKDEYELVLLESAHILSSMETALAQVKLGTHPILAAVVVDDPLGASSASVIFPGRGAAAAPAPPVHHVASSLPTGWLHPAAPPPRAAGSGAYAVPPSSSSTAGAAGLPARVTHTPSPTLLALDIGASRHPAAYAPAPHSATGSYAASASTHFPPSYAHHPPAPSHSREFSPNPPSGHYPPTSAPLPPSSTSSVTTPSSAPAAPPASHDAAYDAPHDAPPSSTHVPGGLFHLE